MRSKIAVVSEAPLREKYQSLLRSDWSPQALMEVLQLLFSQIRFPFGGVENDLLHSLQPIPPETIDVARNMRIVELIRSFSVLINDHGLPPIPDNFPAKIENPIAWYTDATWTYLVLESLADVVGETGFLADTQSMLFLCAADYLLPALDQHGLSAERACLVNALYMHTIVVWRENPAHQYYLQSLVMDYLQSYQRRLDLLERSFRLTPVDDHSYLTKAQSLWSDMVDFGFHETAESFILQLFRYSPTSYLQELKVMLDSTYQSAFTKLTKLPPGTDIAHS